MVNWYGFLWFSMVFYGFVATSSHEENPSALCQATFCRMATTEAPHGGWAVGGPSAISRGPAMDGLVSTSRKCHAAAQRGQQKVDHDGSPFLNTYQAVFMRFCCYCPPSFYIAVGIYPMDPDPDFVSHNLPGPGWLVYKMQNVP